MKTPSKGDKGQSVHPQKTTPETVTVTHIQKNPNDDYKVTVKFADGTHQVIDGGIWAQMNG